MLGTQSYFDNHNLSICYCQLTCYFIFVYFRLFAWHVSLFGYWEYWIILLSNYNFFISKIDLRLSRKCNVFRRDSLCWSITFLRYLRPSVFWKRCIVSSFLYGEAPVIARALSRILFRFGFVILVENVLDKMSRYVDLNWDDCTS